MLLQEVWQTKTGTDGDERSFQRALMVSQKRDIKPTR